MMKRILNLVMHKTYKDNRGLSLVEVLCAVAILALVTGVIGSVIVISTRTYRRGISETNIQQEAQLAANNIGNIVKDACSVIYGESGAQYIKNGKELMSNDDTTPKMQATGFTELSIITNEKIQYTMTYDEGQKKLLYQEFNTDSGSPRTDPEIMATNIVDFKADTTDFENSKTIKLSMKVEDSDTNRSIPMEYTMTSRNGDGEGGEYVINTASVVIIFLEDDVVLVPGETYQIPLSVTGKLNEGGLEWESVTGLTAGALTMDYAEVTVPVDSDGTPASFTIKTKDKDGDGNPKDTASCNVFVRKVSGVAVSHSIDTKNSRGGMLETAGTVYTFNANISGSELTKRVAYAYDSNYKTAQAVVWSWELTADGVTYKRDWTCSQNADGRYEFTEGTDGNQAKFDEYISVTLNKEDAIIPQLIMKIEKDMPADFVLRVRATSKHALGVNKADSQYGNKDDAAYYGEDIVKPRETIVNRNLEIILEPQETGTVHLGMKGGLTSDVTFDYYDATDLYDSGSNTNGTRAVYNGTDDTVGITLGKDEKGSGALGADPYTFTIDVLVSGVKKSTIIVHVCRVDVLSIEVFDNYHVEDGKDPDKNPTYDFRARFNVANGINDAIMQKAIRHLIQYKEDGTPDKEVVKNTLSSRITWELFDHSKSSSQPKISGSVICLAGVGASDKGKIMQISGTDYKKEKNDYYKVENIKPSRIEQNPDGSWYIKQLPEIDIALKSSMLPANHELKITIEALHPLGADGGTQYNKTSEPYGEAKDSVSVKGELTMDTPTSVIVVEPNQGTNDPAQSDVEMVVPIQVHGSAVFKMEAKISGNSSKDTKLSNYPNANDRNGNRNPYMSSNATSAGQMRTWYMGLLIGKDEKGDSNGRIQVHIDAYNSQKTIIASADFDLGVRRVDKIDVKVADSKKISDVNKEGSTVKLDAFPKGRGSNGTEFYDIQKDKDGNICRWEKKGHGEYKEPYPMEWKMVINGTEKALADWTEYIDVEESVKPKTATVPDKNKGTVTFKLKQPLPNGTRIRAYSLHARGKVGDTKYNKSGKEYDEVYGELVIGDEFIVLDDTNFKRGNDNLQTLPVTVTYTDEWRMKYADDPLIEDRGNIKQRNFMHYREEGGDWNPYHKTVEESNTIKINASESYLFRPDKAYEVEYINAVINPDKKILYWPHDKSLLSSAGFEGYTQGWKDSEESTPKKDYMNRYKINAATLRFADPKDHIKNGGRSFGTASEPVQMVKGDSVKIEFSSSGIEFGHFQNSVRADCFSWKNDKWESSLPSNWELQTGAFMLVKIDQNNGKDRCNGKWALGLTFKDTTWKTVSGDLMNPQFSDYTIPKIIMYNLDLEEGVAYFEFNK